MTIYCMECLHTHLHYMSFMVPTHEVETGDMDKYEIPLTLTKEYNASILIIND